MIPASLQEKSQVSATPRPSEDGSNEWASFQSARDAQMSGGSFVEKRADDVDMRRFNEMPPGMDICDQDRHESNPMPLSMAGATDPSQDTTAESMAQGFRKRAANRGDDTETGEHQDLFYGDAGGFVDRNNYLDRL